MAKKAISVGEYITGLEAARLLMKSPRQVRQLAQAGTLQGVKINPRTWLFKRADVLAVKGKLRGRGRPRKESAK